MFKKVIGLIFWLTLGTLGLVTSGAMIYLQLEYFVRREFFGAKLDAPDNWPFFFGCVVIFVLCAYGIWKAITRPVPESRRDAV